MTQEKLLKQLKPLLRNTGIKTLVDARMKEFKRKKRLNELFNELCFCILAANFNAERAWKIQNALSNKFLTLSQKALANELKRLGHRFPNARARYIANARRFLNELRKLYNLNEKEAREWLVKHIKGIGYKEASHFLRNVGFENVAILDFHILNVLEAFNILKKPKTLTKKRYLEIERKLNTIAKRLGITLAELDLYLWYLETGKVLK